MSKDCLNDLDLLRIRFWLSQLVLLLALGGMVVEGVSHSPFLIVLTGFVCLTLFYPPLSGIVPRRHAGKLSLLLLLVVVADFALFWRYSVDPIVRMGLIIIMMRTIFYRTGRETSQILVMALGMIMLTGVTSVSVSYAVQLMLFVPLAMILLMLLTVWDPDAREILTHDDWKGVLTIAYAGRLLRLVHWRFAVMLLIGSVALLVMAIGIFFVFPRMSIGSGLSMRRSTSDGTALVGFSEDFSLGGITEILDDDSVAFLVYPGTQESMPRFPYWRMLVLDHYERGSFSRSSRDAGRLHPIQQTGSRYYLSPRTLPSELASDQGYEWTIYLEGSVSRFLPYPGAFGAVRFQKIEEFEYDSVLGTVNLKRIPSTTTVFQLAGLHPETAFLPSVLDRNGMSHETRFVSPSDAMAMQEIQYPETTQTLILNEADREYLGSLVQSIQRETASAGSGDYLDHAVDHLHRNHEYSLSPPRFVASGLDDDPVIEWMRMGSPGHCEYFAAAFTLLSRAAGYPCRIIKGFSGGEWSEYSEYFVVRNRNAHAWCEVYDPSSGWVRYDPTPPSYSVGNDSRNDRRGGVFGGRWSGWMDTIKMRYYRYVIDFDEMDQMDAAMIVQSRLLSWKSLADRLNSAITGWMRSDDDGDERSPDYSGILVKLLIMSLVTGVGFVSVRYVFRKRSRRSVPLPRRLSQGGFESRYRRKAGKVMRETGLSLRSNQDTIGPLLLIRYGPISDWPANPGRVIRNVSRELRQHKKTGSR